jgi:GDPmannose 4,6-dehydratase
LQDFIETAFEAVGLDWREHTNIDGTLFRPTEIMIGRGDASKAADKLHWQPKFKMTEVVRMMVEAAIEDMRFSASDG